MRIEERRVYQIELDAGEMAEMVRCLRLVGSPLAARIAEGPETKDGVARGEEFVEQQASAAANRGPFAIEPEDAEAMQRLATGNLRLPAASGGLKGLPEDDPRRKEAERMGEVWGSGSLEGMVGGEE